MRSDNALNDFLRRQHVAVQHERLVYDAMTDEMVTEAEMGRRTMERDIAHRARTGVMG